jgi:hypothetical protein
MPPQIQVAGLAAIKIDGELLGYTRNGADTTKEAYWLDVPGDENGGDDGPPIDVQYLGEIARVRLEFTKWDEAVANKVRARVKGGTAGSPADAGTLMAGDGKTVTLTIDSPQLTRHFYKAFPRMPIEMNRGTKFSTLVCEFECHKDGETGQLYTNAS